MRGDKNGVTIYGRLWRKGAGKQGVECVLAEDWEEMKLNEPGSHEAETECMASGEAYDADLLLTSERESLIAFCSLQKGPLLLHPLC